MKDFFNYFKSTTVTKRGYDGKYEEEVVRLNFTKVIVHSVLSVLLLILTLNSYTTVPAGHVKVQTLFGKVVDEELTEGFHIVNPLADFKVFDLRDTTVDIENIMIPAQDKLKTDFDVSLVLKFDGNMASDLLGEVGPQEKVINDIVVKKIRSLLRETGKSVQKSQDFFLETVQVELQQNVKDDLNEYLRKYHINIEAVLFRDITLPKLITNAINQTKQRQEEIEQEKAKLDIIEQQAQQQVVQAKAKEDAAISEANAKRTLADARAYEIETVAQSTAKGNKLVNKTLTKDLIETQRIDKWDGKYPTTIMGESTGVLLNLPNK